MTFKYFSISVGCKGKDRSFTCFQRESKEVLSCNKILQNVTPLNLKAVFM